MNKTILGILTIALASGALISISASDALAYRGDPSVQGPNYTAERHEAMTQAFNDNDYNAWKELMQGRGRVTQVINEDNFAKFSEMHKYMTEGKKEDANKIRAELGLGQKDGAGQGRGLKAGDNRNISR